MKKHKSQIAAAIVISILFVIMVAGYAVIYFTVDDIPAAVKLIVGCVAAAFAAGMLIILKKRISEIRKGETDDLRNY